MCQFVMIQLPGDADLKAAEAVFRKCHLAFAPIVNASLQAQSPPGDLFILTARGLCSCGTPLGSMANRGAVEEALETRVAKLRKQGWSPAKIARWRQEKEVSAEKEARVTEARGEMEGRNILEWVDLLRGLLQTGAASRVGLLLLWLNGTPENSTITLARRQPVLWEAWDSEFLLHIEEFVAYGFLPPRR